MKKAFQFILVVMGLSLVSFFLLSAAESIASAHATVKNTITEPLNMLLTGLGLIGFSSYIKSKTLR